MTDYMFPHSWPLERKRLAMMSAMLDPYTLFRLEQRGLNGGWRCLELGAGNGSMSQELCKRVGPAGHVVAVDLDTAFLSEISEPNLEVRTQNVVEADFEQNTYDLICTRALLHHLPQWQAVLEKMYAALKPGGVLFIQEPDIHPAEAQEASDWRDFWIGFRDWSASIGVDHQLGRKLAAHLKAMGLEDVESFGETINFDGGSGPAQFFSLSMAQIKNKLIGTGHVSPELFERFMKLLEDPYHLGMCISFVTASGRKPG
jgi:SAM-dependent methyltransferase